MDGTPRTRTRRRARQGAPAELAPAPAPAAAAIADDVELLEDRTRPIANHRTGRRLGVSLPSAIFGMFLVSALALGASLQTASVSGGGVGGDGPMAQTGFKDGDAPDGDKPAADQPADEQPGADQPGDKPGADQPGDKPADEPPAEEAPKPAPPAVEEIEIGVGLNEGNVIVEWSACDPDGFVAYKVIRSTDSTVTYPRGENDALVGVIETSSKTRFVDLRAPEGKTLSYRVFAVTNHEGVAFTACRSGVDSVSTPRPEPTPKPTPKPEIGSLGLTLSIRESVPYVDWSACPADGDFPYKVVRSRDAKVSWPLGDYDSLVAAVGSDGTTAVFDEEIGPGKKVFYRVFCLRALDEGYK
ncbi:MAG: hypothetical protein M3R57_08645, partial [Chloroflexota bacterium]|nr:hypothetical protein [Chloroflexota bacterium]